MIEVRENERKVFIVREVRPGVFVRASYGNAITSLDGKRKAPLATIMHSSWSASDRAEYGIYVVPAASIAEGKQRVGKSTFARNEEGEIGEQPVLGDVPKSSETPLQKVEGMLSQFGLTLDEFKKVLGE